MYFYANPFWVFPFTSLSLWNKNVFLILFLLGRFKSISKKFNKHFLHISARFCQCFEGPPSIRSSLRRERGLEKTEIYCYFLRNTFTTVKHAQTGGGGPKFCFLLDVPNKWPLTILEKSDSYYDTVENSWLFCDDFW